MGALNFLGDVATAYNGFNRGVADSQANNNAAEIQAAKMDSFRRQQALEGALRDIGSRIDQSDPNAPTTIPSLSGEMVPTGSQQDQMLADQLPPEDRPAITPQDVGQGALSRAQAMQQMGQAYLKNGDIDHAQRLFSAVQAMENEGDGAIAQGLLLGKDPNQLTAMYNSMGNNRLIPGTLKYDPTTQTATALNQDGSLWKMNPNNYNNFLGATKGLYAKIQSAQAETAAKNAEYQYKVDHPEDDKTPDKVAELDSLVNDHNIPLAQAMATVWGVGRDHSKPPEQEQTEMVRDLIRGGVDPATATVKAAQAMAFIYPNLNFGVANNIPQGTMGKDPKNPAFAAPAPQFQPRTAPTGSSLLQAQAADAIRRGADPAQVNQMLARLAGAK